MSETSPSPIPITIILTRPGELRCVFCRMERVQATSKCPHSVDGVHVGVTTDAKNNTPVRPTIAAVRAHAPLCKCMASTDTETTHSLAGADSCLTARRSFGENVSTVDAAAVVATGVGSDNGGRRGRSRHRDAQGCIRVEPLCEVGGSLREYRLVAPSSQSFRFVRRLEEMVECTQHPISAGTARAARALPLMLFQTERHLVLVRAQRSFNLRFALLTQTTEPKLFHSNEKLFAVVSAR